MNGLTQLNLGSTEQTEQALAAIFDVEITRSRAGPLDIDLTSCPVGECLVYESGTNQPLLVSGARSNDFWTISPITESCAGGRFRGQQLKESNLLILDPGGEIYQQLAAGHRQRAISIPRHLAERIARAEYGLTAEALWGRWCLRSSGSINRQISELLGQHLRGSLFRTLDQSAGEELASAIVAMAQQAEEITQARSSLAHRRRIVRQAEELIRSRLANPPTVTELCEATHTSRRSLFYAFKELIGRTPSAHAKILRLHTARIHIIVRSGERCVQQVAYELGFTHLGQFAIDYAKLFGESPNQTRMHHGGKP
ncbi:helix-turn-helix domain-containing protein [Guyparkeria sp.]|uniref:helix-turn-helix domain-containing protein n=1 Tax=Guyparkeria sp. TaxID=2035736 RepID=UPI00397100F2